MPLLNILPIIFSSLVATLLLYFQADFHLQQQVVVILIILIILLGRQYQHPGTTQASQILKQFTNFFVIFLSSCIIQFIVLSTGGFFSPLLILFHIFGLFIGFILNSWVSLTFLFFSIGLLIGQTVVNPTINQRFMEDPAYVILYLLSFLIIIPAIQYVSQTYNLKNILLDKVNNYLKYTQAKHQVIMSGLKDMVFTLDRDLNIISINEAIQKEIVVSQEQLLNKPFFEVVNLKDPDSQKVTPATLSLDHISTDKTYKTFENFIFSSPFRSQSFRVTVQIRPVLDLKNEVKEILIVISHSFLGSQFKHQDLKDSITKTRLLGYELGKTINRLGFGSLTSKYLLILKGEKDIQIAQELEDHLIESDISSRNIASILILAITQKAELAKSLGSKIYPPPDETSTDTVFNAPIDSEWFKIMIEAVIDLAMFLQTDFTKPINTQVKANSEAVDISISVNTSTNVLENSDLIFGQYSDKISQNTRMILSSRLEGFIVRSIADQLGIKLKNEIDLNLSQITFLITLPKAA